MDAIIFIGLFFMLIYSMVSLITKENDLPAAFLLIAVAVMSVISIISIYFV